MKTAWTRYLVAAALILLVGAVWVLAEEIEMKVEVGTRVVRRSPSMSTASRKTVPR